MPLREGAKEKGGGGGGKEPFLFSPVYEFPEEFGKRKEKVKREFAAKKAALKMTQFCLQNALFFPPVFITVENIAASYLVVLFCFLLLLPADGDFFPFLSSSAVRGLFVGLICESSSTEKYTEIKAHLFPTFSLSFVSSCSLRRIFV